MTFVADTVRDLRNGDACILMTRPTGALLDDIVSGVTVAWLAILSSLASLASSASSDS